MSPCEKLGKMHLTILSIFKEDVFLTEIEKKTSRILLIYMCFLRIIAILRYCGYKRK